MFSRVPLVLLGSLLLLIGYVIGNYHSTVVHAQINARPRERGGTIPKAWGSFKGGINGALIFEAQDGTLRLYEMAGNHNVVEYHRE